MAPGPPALWLAIGELRWDNETIISGQWVGEWVLRLNLQQVSKRGRRDTQSEIIDDRKKCGAAYKYHNDCEFISLSIRL